MCTHTHTHTQTHTSSLYIHFSVSGHLGCFHVLLTVNSAAASIGVHVSFQIMVFSRDKPRGGIAESYGSSVFSLLRNFLTVLHSDYSNYIPTKQGRKVRFLMMVILTDAR